MALSCVRFPGSRSRLAVAGGERGLQPVSRRALKRVYAVAGLWLATAVFCVPATGVAMDVERIVSQNEPAVVVVTGTGADNGASIQGSGCCVDVRGVVIVTAHQVAGAENIEVRLVDGRKVDATVLATDASTETALLKTAEPLPHAAVIGDADNLRSGSPLVSVAAPISLDFTTVTGIVSNTNRKYRRSPDLPYFHVIQADLRASEGSSGGPVFDARGQLVGLIVGRMRDEEWVTLINPVNNAYPLLREYGIGVSQTAGAMPPASNEVIPAEGISYEALKAVRAYNEGVLADQLNRKLVYYKDAVALLPRFFEAWFNLAVAYTAAREIADAVAAYRVAQGLEPESVAVHRNLGRLYLKHEDHLDNAIECFTRAAELAPDDASSYNDLGNAYRAARQLDKAEANFRKALELKPNYAAAHYNLGLTLAAAGRNQEAADAFRDYLWCAPDARDKDEVRSWISELES